MRAAAIAIALSLAGCATVWSTGSFVRRPCLHEGLRLHSDALNDGAVTFRVSTDWPICRQVYPERTK